MWRDPTPAQASLLDHAPTGRAPRVLALHLPDFPLQRRGRASFDPAPAGRTSSAGATGALARGGRQERTDARTEAPIAILDEGVVVCCDGEARAAGVRPGMTAAQALGALGRLTLETLDPAGDRAALRALAEALLALAPAVEVSAPDALLLDASAAHLAAGLGPADAGSERAERGLAARALAVVAEMGYAARAAVATGRAPARALARAFPADLRAAPRSGEGDRRQAPVIRAAPGAERQALAALPIAALGLPPAVVARLAEVGIVDAGGLTGLPEGTLAHRFGPPGVAAARLARGEDASPLVAYTPETLPEEGLELEAPAESAEPLLFGLKRLADRVAARLAGRGLGATRLRVVLKLDPRGEERIDLALAQPTAIAARWMGPLKEHLFSLRLPGAVVALRLVAVEVAAVAVEQLALRQDRDSRSEVVDALETVLARLSVRLGDGALFAAEPVARYRPERAYRAVPFASRPRSGRTPGADVPEEAAHRPTRLLPAPELVVAEGEGGRITAVRVGGEDRTVLSLEGPERLAGEWWSERFDRDYFRVRLQGLGDCWIYRDGGDGRLYLHGFFD